MDVMLKEGIPGLDFELVGRDNTPSCRTQTEYVAF